MTSTNGQAENSVEITTAHLQELFRRLPAAAEVMRMIMLEAENASLKPTRATSDAEPPGYGGK